MRVFPTYAKLQAALARQPNAKHAFRFLPQYMPAGFICSTCKQTIPFKLGAGTGYGLDSDAKMHCYACCGEREKAALNKEGKGILYLSGNHVTDWPGTLSFPVLKKWSGRHNMAGRVYFVQFIGPDGKIWFGKQYGDNTQICHVRRLKCAS